MNSKIEGISDLRDESGPQRRVRIVIELKANAPPTAVLKNLYQSTRAAVTFGATHAGTS